MCGAKQLTRIAHSFVHGRSRESQFLSGSGIAFFRATTMTAASMSIVNLGTRIELLKPVGEARTQNG
jgi:hypothetical protein